MYSVPGVHSQVFKGNHFLPLVCDSDGESHELCLYTWLITWSTMCMYCFPCLSFLGLLTELLLCKFSNSLSNGFALILRPPIGVLAWMVYAAKFLPIEPALYLFKRPAVKLSRSFSQQNWGHTRSLIPRPQPPCKEERLVTFERFLGCAHPYMLMSFRWYYIVCTCNSWNSHAWCRTAIANVVTLLGYEHWYLQRDWLVWNQDCWLSTTSIATRPLSSWEGGV